MMLETIATVGGFVVTISGVLITFGTLRQQILDNAKGLTILEEKLEETIKNSIENGNKIIRLETQYTEIITRLAELKSDIRSINK